MATSPLMNQIMSGMTPTLKAPSAIGVQAKAPTNNLSTPSNVLPPNQVKLSTSQPATPNTSGLDYNSNPYYLRPGESTDAYNSRVAGYNSTQAPQMAAPQAPAPVTPTPAAPSTPAPYTQNTGLYGQLITGLANQSQTNVADDPSVTAARNSLKDLQSNYATQTANIEGSPIDLSLATGQEGILNRLFAAKQTAAQSALQTATESALQGQGLKQSALQNAGQLAAPQQVPYSNQYLSPVTGQSLNPQAQTEMNGAVGSLAMKVQNNTMSYSDARNALSAYGQAGINALNQALGPNFNVNTSQGVSSAQQSNAQVGGTAGVTAAQGVFNQAYGAYTQLQNSTQNIDQFGSLLLQTMQQGGINPSDVKYANQTLAAVRGQLSNAQQAVYDNTLASLRSRVSGLLAAGGSEVPTAITADAQKILDGSLPLSSITQVLARIKQEGEVLLQNQGKIVNDNYAKVQGGNAGTTNATGNSIYNF